MTDEEPQPRSAAQLIATFNQGARAVPRNPPPDSNQATSTAGRTPPPPPPRPSAHARPSAPGRAVSANVPTRNGPASSNGAIANLPEEGEAVAPRPTLPTRTSTQFSRGPDLPPRRPSGSLAPPARTQQQPPPPLPLRTNTAQAHGAPGRVQSPPALPSRATTIQPGSEPTRSPPPARQVVQPPPRRSALTMGMNQATNTAPTVPVRPTSVPQTNGNAAPPVPTASRPNLAALQASKPRVNGAAPTAADSCLHCRDFSAPDNHAARLPREALPSQDLGWLANQLTSPFPSHTDKARAIFTWLHHNVAYDTVAFFAHNVRPSTPQSTLSTGLAVCEGYAGLFAALAIKAGLEAYVVGGNGKGFGHTELQPGDPIPPYKAGHAWNAVRIDGGAWKLIDCCWGAGCVQGAHQPYRKRFAPERFTQSNDDFGLDHFPEDRGKQFRHDGRVVAWDEYITGHKNGCGADFFAGFVAEEGLDKTSFRPRDGRISLAAAAAAGPTLRFAFQKVCPHWDPLRCGPGAPYVYVLALAGLEGTPRNHVPFDTDGSVWWCDVPVRDLGPVGGKVQIYTVTRFDGGDGRGLTVERYRQKKGRVALNFGGVCRWEVVA